MNPGKKHPIPEPPPPALEVAEPARALNRCDDHFYEELTRINNELANLHREVARQNADLAAAQKKLQVSEQRYRSLSACSPIGILEMDVAGRCLYTNPHWQAITGLSADESLGDGWQGALDKRDGAAFLAEWNPAPRAGLEFSREVRFVTTHGDQRWAQVRSRAILAPSGEIAGRVSTVEDITSRKQAEVALEKAHLDLVDVSRRAGMAEVAASVLHNVGNVLNSVNVATACVAERIRESRSANLSKVVTMLREHEADLAAFLSDDPKGTQLPGYLEQLAGHLAGEQAATLTELDGLQRNIEHINDIVAMQQSYATFGGVKEIINVVNLVEDSLRMHEDALRRHRVEVVREFESVPPLNVEKHKILQILVNLVRNAKYACDESDRPDKRMTVRVANGNRVRISVMDNGIGIPPENLTRIFSHGFTTRKGGHGFGLHSSALAAMEMGGSLTVQSDGPGQGAIFTLELPGPTQEDSHE
jgi:PAS domain S-box-containing protein